MFTEIISLCDFILFTNTLIHSVTVLIFIISIFIFRKWSQDHSKKHISHETHTATNSAEIMTTATETTIANNADISGINDIVPVSNVVEELIISTVKNGESITTSANVSIENIRNSIMEPEVVENTDQREMICENETLRYELFHLKSKSDVVDQRIQELERELLEVQQERTVIFNGSIVMKTEYEKMIQHLNKLYQSEQEMVQDLTRRLQIQEMFHKREVDQLNEKYHLSVNRLYRAEGENLRFHSYMAKRFPDIPVDVVLTLDM
jgi:hypothetical protein